MQHVVTMGCARDDSRVVSRLPSGAGRLWYIYCWCFAYRVQLVNSQFVVCAHTAVTSFTDRRDSMKDAEPTVDPELNFTTMHQQHYSIDFSIELERQLDMESLPSTPNNFVQDADTQALSQDSLDPQLHAQVVAQLRDSLTQVTKERDQLKHLLFVAQSQEAGMREAVTEAKEKVRVLGEELSEAQAKNKDDEDSIMMLRSKVEESRYVGTIALQNDCF